MPISGITTRTYYCPISKVFDITGREIKTLVFEELAAGTYYTIEDYYSARELKKAAARQLHPEWTDEEAENKVRESICSEQYHPKFVYDFS